ncbi:MAG: DUF4838 domain-containing protein [Pirellulales bacterium]
MKLIAPVIGFCVLVNATAALAETPPAGVDLAALSDWDIVVADNAIESELFAAEEFQRLYKQASGVELPIVRQSTRPNRHIFIGPGEAMRGSPVGFDIAPFGQEDLRIIVRDENIAIAGGRPRGTLYGVYTFLEDYLGVRFLTAEHTHAPPVGDWRKIGPVDRFYHPPMDYRWVGYEANYHRPEFAARLRLNAARLPACPVDGSNWTDAGKYGGRTSMQEIEHTFDRQLPPAKYAQDHPEYYALFDGKRYATLKPGTAGIEFKRSEFAYGLQPCLTHPDVFRIITDNVLTELASRQDLLNAVISQNDGGVHCKCPTCAAIDEREGGPTGSLLEFVNQVADEVAREYPDRMVSTLAYSDTARSPKTLRPRDNVQISWCSIGTCFIHAFDDPSCPQNELHISQLRQWAKISPHLYTWNYYFNDENHSSQLPLPNLRLIDENIRFQLSLGVRGMFMQATASCHGNEFEELRNYMLASLMWDPSRDAHQLMREWLELHYGPAAPPIARWIDRLHDRSLASGKHCRCLGGKFSDYGLDESDAEAGLDAIEEAMLLAGGDEVLRVRVEKASIWAYRAAIEPVWYAQEGDAVDPALVERMGPMVNRFFELCRKHGVTRTVDASWFEMEIYENRLRQVLGLTNTL